MQRKYDRINKHMGRSLEWIEATSGSCMHLDISLDYSTAKPKDRKRKKKKIIDLLVGELSNMPMLVLFEEKARKRTPDPYKEIA